MRRKAPVLFLVMALILAGAAAWGAQRWMRGRAVALAAKQVSLGTVVIAASDLQAGSVLEPTNLVTRKWPKAVLPQGAFSSAANLKGRVLKTDLAKGEVVLAAKLAKPGLAGGLSSVVPDGYRALTLKIDEVIGVAGFVQPGDRVDVLLTFAKGPFKDNPVTRTFLQNVEVLTVGERVENSDSKAKAHKAKVATLKLEPTQAERLALAMTEGKVVLALRNRGDELNKPTGGVRLAALLPPPAKPKEVEPEVSAVRAEPVKEMPPVSPPPEPKKQVVEVIKGVTKSVQTL